MKDKRNIIAGLLSWITYKKPREVKEFYIPRVGEEGSDEGAPDAGGSGNGDSNKESSGKGVPNKGDSGNGDPNAGGSGNKDAPAKGAPVQGAKPEGKLKKPKPAGDCRKEKQEKKAGKAETPKEQEAVPEDIRSNIAFIQQKFNHPVNKDIVIREFAVAGKHKAFIAFLEGMADRHTVNNFILRPLLKMKDDGGMEDPCLLDAILESVIETNQTTRVTEPGEVIEEILMGNTVLYVDGCDYYISSETKGFEKRSVDKPQIEGVVKGSQEGYTENLRTNITLIRRIIKNQDLTTEFIKLGKRNKCLCAVIYIKDLVNPAIVKEVKRRIEGIDTDFIYGEGMVEQFIEDNPWSLIPTVLATERPDRTASHLVEGRVAILIDGTPFADIVPVTLHSLFHSPEDINLRWQYGSLLRYVRLTAAFIATLLPAVYVALTSFHQEMIPTDLLIAIAKAKENVPFPSVIELLLMELSFELIREAGIRIPGIIGNTLGIIGALILGQAAVQANIVSPILIIIVAVTGLGNFAIPSFSLAFGARILRFLFIFAGASLGFYGISLMLVALLALAGQMKSFGVPFLTASAPVTRKGYDVFMRWPLWQQEKRPDYLNPLDVRRQPEISRKWTKKDPKTDYMRGDRSDEGR